MTLVSLIVMGCYSINENVVTPIICNDEQSAIRAAEVVWLQKYGDSIYKEKPFKASLNGEIWTVSGTLPEGYLGGVAFAEIQKKDCKVIRIWHYS